MYKKSSSSSSSSLSLNLPPCDNEVYIVFEIGSRAKGFAVDGVSDRDIIEITKCSPSRFMEHILDDSKRLHNTHTLIRNEQNSNIGDLVKVDLFVALRGVYTGKYYYLAAFATRSDMNNDNLYEFVHDVALLRLPMILHTMIKYRPKSKLPKNLLGIVYNLLYVNYCLNNNNLPNPETCKLMDLVKDLSNDDGVVYNKVDTKFCADLISYNQCAKHRLQSYKDDNKYANAIEDYRNHLLDRMKSLPDKLARREDIENAIISNMLYGTRLPKLIVNA
ncbi:HE65 [Perigonia lusca single nucleopolyhedrovirus]|uniref:HE65 n=1 Tax=Perigonia lusca single nucleopolyhedrovirus TaxID=1675865 RepID=A0A0M3WNK4_9ABAC|nr:HE65 [Perigonia lusca single nucleopolyhedrovirus]AKN80608.1 HE65 [Perigonia lusca single nucleopolyhedrovirus]